MAGTNIPPRMTVEGIAHRVTTRRLEATESLPARDCANVVVLTAGGGFVEVYVAPEKIADVPQQGSSVHWLVDVQAWNRATRDGERTFATLAVRLADALPVEPAIPAGEVADYSLSERIAS